MKILFLIKINLHFFPSSKQRRQQHRLSALSLFPLASYALWIDERHRTAGSESGGCAASSSSRRRCCRHFRRINFNCRRGGPPPCRRCLAPCARRGLPRRLSEPRVSQGCTRGPGAVREAVGKAAKGKENGEQKKKGGERPSPLLLFVNLTSPLLETKKKAGVLHFRRAPPGRRPASGQGRRRARARPAGGEAQQGKGGDDESRKKG